MKRIFFIILFAFIACKEAVSIDNLIEEIPDDSTEHYVLAYNNYKDVFVYDSITKSLKNITNGMLDTLFYARASSFSDDGRKLLFIVDYEKIVNGYFDNCNRDDIFVYDLINEEIERITDTEYRELNPKFSKDGKSIIFSSRETGNSNICIIQNNEKRVVENNKHYESGATFLMNDSKIIYISVRDNNTDIYLNDYIGGNEKQLTYDGYSKSYPSVATNDSFFVYSKNIGKQYGIYKYSFINHTSKLLLNENFMYSQSAESISTPVVSYDNKYIVYRHFDGGWIHLNLINAESQIELEDNKPIYIGKGIDANFTKNSENVIYFSGQGINIYNIKQKTNKLIFNPDSYIHNLVVSGLSL